LYLWPLCSPPRSIQSKRDVTDEGERLLNHYMEKYKPLIEDSFWDVFGLELKLEAQTEKYVTYGLEFFHCGEGFGSEKYYYTFDKSDGQA